MPYEVGEVVQLTVNVSAAARDYGRRHYIWLAMGTVGVIERIEDGPWQKPIFYVRIPGRRSKSAARHGRPNPIAELGINDIEPANVLDRLLYEVASYR